MPLWHRKKPVSDLEGPKIQLASRRAHRATSQPCTQACRSGHQKPVDSEIINDPKTIASSIKSRTQMTSNKTQCQTNSRSQRFYLLMKITCPQFRNGQEHFKNLSTDCTLIVVNQLFYLLMKITCPQF